MTIVQDMEIVFGYSGYDFINETKMGTKRHQDEVKPWVLMHQDEALQDDQNGHIDRLIRSPGVGVMAPESSPIWAKPI